MGESTCYTSTYVDLFRLRLPINPREQTFAQMPPSPSLPPSLVRIKEEKAVGEHLAGFTAAFSSNSTFHSIGGKNSRWRQKRIDSNEIGRSHTRIRAPFSSASFECSALDLLPARTRSRTTLDNITKVKGSEAGGRFQFTHMLVPPWQNNQSEPPYQPLSIADLSRNLCQNRRHLRGRLQTA